MESSRAERKIKRKEIKWHHPRTCPWERVGERTTGRNHDALFIVNCPAFWMSPEDTATINMQPDTHSDYTF
jgi:hypothetical protein